MTSTWKINRENQPHYKMRNLACDSFEDQIEMFGYQLFFRFECCLESAYQKVAKLGCERLGSEDQCPIFAQDEQKSSLRLQTETEHDEKAVASVIDTPPPFHF